MKNFKLILAAMTALCVMTACGGNTDSTADTSAETASETVQAEDTQAEEAQASEETSAEETTEEDAEDEENYNTGDASLDNIRNQDEIGENELLAVSFGTSFNDSRRLTIGAIENDLETAFPDYSVRRGFTANIVIDHVQRRDGILIDDLNAALQRAADNGVKNLVIQPTHLMNGLEYDEIVDTAANYSDAFDKVVFGAPLLTSDDDFDRVAKAITDWTSEYDDGETAICFMGHGTEADSNSVYSKMQDTLTNMGFANYYVGTVEATPSLDDVLAKVKEGNYKRVVLEPLMVVAGDHANNDMAGDDEDSWKSQFEASGEFDSVDCQIAGLGEVADIQQLYVAHTKAAVDSLNG